VFSQIFSGSDRATGRNFGVKGYVKLVMFYKRVPYSQGTYAVRVIFASAHRPVGGNNERMMDSRPSRLTHGANRPIGAWPVRSLTNLLRGLFAPLNFRSLALSLPSQFAP